MVDKSIALLFFVVLLAVSFAGGAAAANAPSISPAQLEQFKKLPREQQEALARQYGIDLSMLERQGVSGEGASFQDDPQTVFSRDERELDRERERERVRLRDEDKDQEKEVEAFGYNLFSGSPSTFAPVNNAPVPGNYRISVGDTVLVQLFGQESISHTLVVDREGRISIPRIGPIAVGGLSYDELKSIINHHISTRLIGTQAAISMGELRTMQVFVLGEAYQPGAYTMGSLTTISQALFASGGVTDIASLRNIRLMRAGEVVTEFDLYDLLVHGNGAKDRILQPGDAVFIPPRGAMVKVTGEVVRPAIYEIKAGETLADVIQLAGGMLPSAYQKAVQLQRAEGGQRQLRTLDATQLMAKNITLQGGDELTVPTISAVIDDSIRIIGAVTRPGNYEWRAGLRLSHFVSSVTQDLMPDADLSYGLVVREGTADKRIKVLQFDVSSALGGHAKHDLALEPRDQVLFFSRFEYEYQRALAGFGDYAGKPEEVLQEERNMRRQKQFEEELATQALNPTLYTENRNEPQRRDQRADTSRDNRTEPRRDVRRDTRRDNGRDNRGGNVEAIDDEAMLVPTSRQVLLRSVLARLQSQETQDASALYVHINGEVRFPGSYPLTENGTVAELIAAAGGLRDSAYLARAEITRTVIEGDVATTEYLPFNLLDAITGSERMKVNARDRLNVFKIPEWQDTVDVKIAGEVRFPGTYSVRRGEKLSDLIVRAGGLTDYAYANGTVFTREEVRQRERERIDGLVRTLRQEMASISLTEGSRMGDYEQLNMLLNDLQGADPVGRMVLNMPEIISGKKNRDVELRDQDSIYIPAISNSVSIVGEVHMPSTYRFDPAYSVREYLDRSGGTKRRADSDRMFVVRANGEVVPYSPRRGWFSSNQRVALEPGDTIVVPLDSSYRETSEVWATSTQIIYQLAVAAAAISRI